MKKENSDKNKKSGKKEIIEGLDKRVDPLNDQKQKLDAKKERLAQDLKYDAEDSTYERDVDPEVKAYQHPDPYETGAPGGSDMNSDWDEANQQVGDEYEKNRSLEEDAEDLGMHIDEGKITELDPMDERLAETPEDKKKDLDEEGYPKNDRKEGES